MGELVEWEKSGVVAETDRTPSSAEVARRSGRRGGGLRWVDDSNQAASYFERMLKTFRNIVATDEVSKHDLTPRGILFSRRSSMSGSWLETNGEPQGYYFERKCGFTHRHLPLTRRQWPPTRAGRLVRLLCRRFPNMSIALFWSPELRHTNRSPSRWI